MMYKPLPQARIDKIGFRSLKIAYPAQQKSTPAVEPGRLERKEEESFDLYNGCEPFARCVLIFRTAVLNR